MNNIVRRYAGSCSLCWLRHAVCLLPLLLCGEMRAQEFTIYTFSRHTAPYVEPADIEPIAFGWASDTQRQLFLPAGTFSFFGQKTDFRSPSTIVGLVASGELVVLLDTMQFSFLPFLAPLEARNASSTPGEGSLISHGMYESNDDTVYVLQWSNAGFATGDTSNYVNFQVWLYQNSGVIEYRYGPSHVTSAEPFGGDRGPTVGIMASDRQASSWYRSAFVTGPAESPDLEIGALFPSLIGVPPNGTIYRFTPTASASVEEVDESRGLRAHPSIVRDVVTVELDDEPRAGATAAVRDLLGRQVHEASIDGRSSTLDLSGLTAGTYWIEIETGSGLRRVMIQKQ